MILRETAATGNTRNLRTVWRINLEKGTTGHAAPFPQALAATCIALATRPADAVLDPFVGSGTTALVAHQLGRTAIGIELNPDYADIAQERLSTTPLTCDPTTISQALTRLTATNPGWAAAQAAPPL
jgi:site-specific DNA-methyltransferase (cytosine-N4-specific)